MAASNLRFVILGDDKASSAFNRFARNVDQANRSVDRNNAALRASGKSSAAAQGGFLALTGTITGFSDAMNASSSSNGRFAKGMAGLSLATGLLEPQMAGLVVAVGGLASAFAAAGVGLGAYGLALGGSLTKILDAMKKQAQALASGTPAAAKKAQAAMAALTVSQRQFAVGLSAAKAAYVSWSDQLSSPVLAPLTQGLKLVKPLLADLTPIVKLASGAIGFLIDHLSTSITGGGFAKWLDSIKPVIVPAIISLGLSIGHIGVGLGGIIKAFVPFAPKITSGIEHLTAAFARWGTTLTSHSGFQALIGMFRKDTPVVNQLLKNLAVIVKNVVSAMTGFSSPANSFTLLTTLKTLSGVLAQLSKNKALLNLALQFLLIKSIAGQVTGPIKGVQAGISGIGDTYKNLKTGVMWLGNFRDGFKDANAAASAFSGTAGTLGGNVSKMITAVKSWSIWEKIAAKATVVWTFVQKGLNWAFKDNPIGLVITAIGLLIGAVIYAYKHFKWFRDFVNAVWRDIKAWTIDAWHWILGAIKAAWNWVKQNWPLLLGILTGPIGLAVALIIKYWDKIVAGAKTLWHLLKAGWNAAVHAVVDVVKWLADRVLNFWGMILHGAVAMFGWVPGVGGKLKSAAAAFDRFHARVDKALSFKGKTVSVGVDFQLGGGGRGQRTAAAGWRVPGYGGGDKWPALLEGGEAVVPKHLVPAIAPFLSANRVPGFAAGGVAGGISVHGGFPSVAAMAAAALRVIQHMAQRNIGALLGGSGSAGGGVTRWAGVILTALRLLGQSAGWLGLVERRMNQESGGNPLAINKWDSNWAAGTPSVGLMQVIGPTFGTFAGPFRNIGPFAYGTSENPLANVYAGLNYALHRYRSLAALGQPGGYDYGGWLPPGGVGVNTTSRPEMIRSARQEDALGDKLDRIAGLLGALIGAVDDIAPATSAGVAGALGGAARSAAHRAEWSPR